LLWFCIIFRWISRSSSSSVCCSRSLKLPGVVKLSWLMSRSACCCLHEWNLWGAVVGADDRRHRFGCGFWRYVCSIWKPVPSRPGV
jgi:hypothetical protein